MQRGALLWTPGQLFAGGIVVLALAAAGIPFPTQAQDAGEKVLTGHVPGAIGQYHLQPVGRLPAAGQLSLAIGLPFRNQAELNELLRQLYDPASVNFHKFLAPREFTARFGPAEQDYQAVREFAESRGLTVSGTHPNRLVLDVTGSVSNIERAFQVTLHVYPHPTEARTFYAPDTEPSVDANLPVLSISGLDNFALPHPKNLRLETTRSPDATPKSGSGSNGSYAGGDFRAAYVPGTVLDGSGQSVALLEFDGYYASDITKYENSFSLPAVPLVNVAVDGGVGSPGSGNSEVALDIEMAVSMATNLSSVIIYEAPNPSPWPDLLNRMANDNLARQISCSWSGGSPDPTSEQIFQQMAAQGQSFFNASGDSDAFTGPVPFPSDSTNITQVGGTTLTTSGPGGSWSSETVWNWGSQRGKYVGSSGGVSTYYSIPFWQLGISMTANLGSTTMRDIPDVALTADNIWVDYNNGQGAAFGGTSCAAPLWAAFTALVNQQAAAAGQPSVGFINPAVYSIGKGGNYTADFHDITTGNNFSRSSPNKYPAVTGYDLCTGWGTPNGTNLINALAPPPVAPYFNTQPSSRTVTNGANVTFAAAAAGAAPLNYQWLFNGAALSSGTNISGVTSNTLTLAPVAFANAGNYSLLVTNSFGSVTSSVATLTVLFPPSFIGQPTNQTVLAGSNVVFSASVTGALPLAYQWRHGGTNLANNGSISGATTNVLTVNAVTNASAGSYTLAVTNIYGAATSSAAILTVVQAAAITVPPAPQAIQCGSNAAFNVTVAGTAPLACQWSLDGATLAGATNTSLSLTNVHLPGHTVVVVVTNLYGSATSSAALTVQDTLPPVITLNSTNPFYVELGSAYVEPGATAYDLCAGVVPVTAAGAVNTGAVGTNTVTYTATDGDGNTNTAARTVIVRDTTPPVILWSFTNLTLAAGTNCNGMMPDVTGTNDVRVTDLSGAVDISQSPANGAALPLGTNIVLISAADASGNTSYSTNRIVVLDETPPVILLQPQSRTNSAGTTALFSVGAAACTPLAFQWFYGNAAMAGQTNDTLTFSNVLPSSAGNYFVVATAGGGSTTSSVVSLTVNLVTPDITLISASDPDGFKSAVNFTAQLAPTNAGGSVQFLTNGAVFDAEPLATGVAVSTNLSGLPRGTNVITAIYSGDADDLPATNTLAQIVTNHPPMAAGVFYHRLGGYPLDIAVADLATNWSDADGDTVSLASIGVSTNGVTVTSNAGTLVYFDAGNVDDQFACVISDGWGGTNFQIVHIVIMPADAMPAVAAVGSGFNGGVTLDLAGAAGYTYVLETRTNLSFPAVWLPLATNTLGTNGVWQFTDPGAANFPHRFYRLMLPPQ